MSINSLQEVQEKNDTEILEKFENFDAEIAVIGCLLWDNKSYEKIWRMNNKSKNMKSSIKIRFNYSIN